jgi:hypothetical protein
LWHTRVFFSAWLGSGDRAGDAELSEDAEVVVGIAVDGEVGGCSEEAGRERVGYMHDKCRVRKVAIYFQIIL